MCIATQQCPPVSIQVSGTGHELKLFVMRELTILITGIRYPSASHGMAPLNTAGLHGARGEVTWRCRGCYRRDAEQGDEEGQRAGTQLALSWRDHSHEWGRASAELTQQATLGPGPAFSLSHAPHLPPHNRPLPGLGPAVLWDTTTQNRTSPLSPLTSDPPDHQALFTVNSNRELNGCS